MSADILVVDDESGIRSLIKGILEDEGYSVRQAASASEAYEQVEKQPPNLIILDVWLQNSSEDGLQILEKVKADHPLMPILMISGHGTIETAVGAIKLGAYDFIEKPFKTDRLLLMIDRALENARLRQENALLRTRAEAPSELVGDSASMTTLKNVLTRVAQTNSRVLLTGQPGTGKDVAARAIHKSSQRAQGPFMVLNCAILRPDHLESELFGVAPGAPGQEAARSGVLEQAHGGTLLLDEVADIPLETQGKIVRVLQEQRFQRVGGQTPVEVDVRIIASTNRDLQELIKEGRYREDLYYRLNVVPIALPTLRERMDDIEALSEHFAQAFSAQAGIPSRAFSSAALMALQAYDWPGNVRQLRNVVEWVMIMGAGAPDAVKPENLPPEISGIRTDPGGGVTMGAFMSTPLREAREMFEKEYLEGQIRRFNGNISKTAQFVGMERSALHRKLKQLGISDMAKQNGDDPAESVQDNRKTA